MKKIWFTCVVFFLAGCGLSSPKDISELKTSAHKQEGFFLNKNYQFLAKCWDEHAQKPSDVLGGTAFLKTSYQVYPDLGLAQMSVGGDGHNLYHLILELRKKAYSKTYVISYSTDGFRLVSQKWSEILKACATESP